MHREIYLPVRQHMKQRRARALHFFDLSKTNKTIKTTLHCTYGYNKYMSHAKLRQISTYHKLEMTQTLIFQSISSALASSCATNGRVHSAYPRML